MDCSGATTIVAGVAKEESEPETERNEEAMSGVVDGLVSLKDGAEADAAIKTSAAQE